MKTNQQKKNKGIPNGWNSVPLGDICIYRNGNSFEKFVMDSGRYSLITLNSIDINGQIKLEHKFVDSADWCLERDDLIMVLSDIAHGNFLGLVDKIPENNKFVLNQRMGLLRNNSDNMNTDFIRLCLNKNRRFFKRQGQGSSQQNLSKGDILKFSVIHPPLLEQKRIVKVLETWDKYIEKLERKIALKHEVKNGLMQQLLTGKKRLPGFSGEWEEKRLGDIGETYSGLTGKTKEDFTNDKNVGSPFISYMNIYSNSKINTKDIGTFVKLKSCDKQNSAKYGDLFFTTSSETPNEVGVASVLLDKKVSNLYLNSFCFGFRLGGFSVLLPEYSQYYFRGQDFRKKMTRIAQGASRFNLSKKYFMDTTIDIPRDVKEQKAIAKVLTIADTEIDTLEQKLALVREQKKYLLNNLVTGEIRTPEDL